ncbi:MAG: alpha/beta fold hydrolase [Candidatus Eremiobacteraeota bacterium]|nr:alpha/beta fold hydrolase [Candidatus Eremiobacteraeota bacterium]
MLRSLVLLAGLGLVPKLAGAPPQPVVLSAADGVAIYAIAYEVPSPAAPVILLFHQAGSSKSEYAPIAPRLTALGYNALAIDQRSGGDLYSPPNETVQHLGKSAADYRAALPDMDAALAWAKKTHPRAPIYAWGSSYSAALVFAFAAKHPRDIKAVLAFSPGEYVPGDKRFVRDAAGRVTCPVFVDSAADASEERGAKAILDAVRSSDKVEFVPHAGIHGASTLREDRDAGGSAENWDAVTRFLSHVTETRT